MGFSSGSITVFTIKSLLIKSKNSIITTSFSDFNITIFLKIPFNNILDRKQRYLAEIIDTKPEITVTYFVPDEKKSGGAYSTVTGFLKRIDEYERVLMLTDGRKIQLDAIFDIESDEFENVL